MRVSEHRIREAVESRKDWIANKLSEWAIKPQPRQAKFEDGEIFPYLGGHIRLCVIENTEGARTRTRFSDATLTLSIDPELTGDLRAATLRRAMERWYRKEAAARFPERVEHYARQLERTVTSVQVREQKRRWGSCDSKGVIRLNWRLIGAEPDLIDYVCAHEVAHLIEPNHSPRFWAVVEGLMPDWKRRRRQLNASAAGFVPF